MLKIKLAQSFIQQASAIRGALLGLKPGIKLSFKLFLIRLVRLIVVNFLKFTEIGRNKGV